MNLRLLPVVGVILFTSCGATQKNFLYKKPTQKKVVSVIDKVNDYWQSSHPNAGWAFWDEAAYHTGNMAAYRVTKKDAYKDYSEKWQRKINGWAPLLQTNLNGNIIMVKPTSTYCLAIGRFVFRHT